MKYCPRCANIVSDKSNSRFMTECCNCHIPFEEDKMTGDMFENLSDKEKEEYTISLLNTIKKSPLFDEKACYYGHPDFYWSYWFDKYEEIMSKHGTAWKADRIESEEEHNQWLEENFGKDSPDYHKAVAQQYIDKARVEKESNTNTPKCPTCGSTNIEKIGGLERAGSVYMFGIFSKKINKSFKCCNCKFTW